MRPWRRRKETLGAFSLYAKRYKSVYISVNKNTNLNLSNILSNYIIWDRLSQKTISRYCPFKSANCPLAASAAEPIGKYINYKKSICVILKKYSCGLTLDNVLTLSHSNQSRSLPWFDLIQHSNLTDWVGQTDNLIGIKWIRGRTLG